MTQHTEVVVVGGGLPTAMPVFARLTADGVRWGDASHTLADTVIWCTGLRPAPARLPPPSSALAARRVTPPARSHSSCDDQVVPG